MFEINGSLIERQDDLSFFDPSRFFVYKFNRTGYQIIAELKTKAFQKTVFLEKCRSIRMSSDAADLLWEKCWAHQIIVQAQ